PLSVLLAGVLLAVRCPVWRLRGWAGSRLVPALAAVCLLAVGGTDYYLQPRLFNEQLVYTDVFYTILADSHDVPADLAEFGLPPELSRYAGQSWFVVSPQLKKDPAYQVFLQKITMTDVAGFYARHPDRFWTVARS